MTSAASGIGALASRSLAQGATGVLVADINAEQAGAVAQKLSERPLAARCDVGVESDIQTLVAAAETLLGGSTSMHPMPSFSASRAGSSCRMRLGTLCGTST